MPFPRPGAGVALAIFLNLNFAAPAQQAGDAGRGATSFQQNCAICHSDTSGENRQGPTLSGVTGRKAAEVPGFGYSPAMRDSKLTWDAPTLDRFLTDPAKLVPGTTMSIAIANGQDRADIVAYLGTLKPSTQPATAAVAAPESAAPSDTADSDNWHADAPGTKHHISIDKLPAPFQTTSAGNGPRVVPRPDNAMPVAPAGFTVKLFASGLKNPRLLRVAPNGDIFLAETGANRLSILRSADGADTPSIKQVFADGLDHPFGIAFYPPGNDPKWIYVANNNSVVRMAYHAGDLQATGQPEVVVPKLTDSGGGHSTRDVAFSADGKRMFISVGSGSNVAEHMSRKNPDEARAWEAEHGFGSSWDAEANRAAILVCDPEGKEPLRTYASGIRNGVGIAVNPANGELWTSTNERDGLGDDLVPDYLSSVKEHGYYGWPWYYLGNHEDPRHKGDRPDLAGKAIVPDIPVQAHSASLEMTFYPPGQAGAAAFPSQFQGDAFAAFHGSWNRSLRTGYKVVRARFNHGHPVGGYEDFLTGFVVDDRSVWGRPVGVTVAHDGALLVTEDGNNTLWRVAPDAPARH